MKAIQPILVFLFSYLAGYLAIQGKIQAHCQSDVIAAFVEVAGYMTIFGTSVASIMHVFKHPPHLPFTHTAKQPVAVPVVKNPEVVEPVFTTGDPTDSGTPPPSV